MIICYHMLAYSVLKVKTPFLNVTWTMRIDPWSQSAGALASTIKSMAGSPRFSGATFKPTAGWLRRHCQVPAMLVFQGYWSKMVMRLLVVLQQSQESTMTKMTGAAEDEELVRIRDMRQDHLFWFQSDIRAIWWRFLLLGAFFLEVSSDRSWLCLATPAGHRTLDYLDNIHEFFAITSEKLEMAITSQRTSDVWQPRTFHVRLTQSENSAFVRLQLQKITEVFLQDHLPDINSQHLSTSLLTI